MPITSKYTCKNCDFTVIVEAEVSEAAAIEQCFAHLNDNRTHELPGPKTIWTDNPYIPPEETPE